MHTTESAYLAWGLLAAFLVLGLVLYERTGRRLGGVLVLPLLLVYAIFDIDILVVFALSAALALAVGQFIHSQALVYGRRLLYVFLLVGIVATFLARQYVDISMGGFILALLPGLFAYNLHREGRYVEGTAAFALWFGILLTVAVASLWIMARPESVVQAWASLTERGGIAAMETLFAQRTGLADGLAPSAVAAASIVEAARDTSGVAE